MIFAPQNSMLDWFRDQDRRLQAWRQELAAKGSASADQLAWLARHQDWLKAEVKRLSV